MQGVSRHVRPCRCSEKARRVGVAPRQRDRLPMNTQDGGPFSRCLPRTTRHGSVRPLPCVRARAWNTVKHPALCGEVQRRRRGVSGSGPRTGSGLMSQGIAAFFEPA